MQRTMDSATYLNISEKISPRMTDAAPLTQKELVDIRQMLKQHSKKLRENIKKNDIVPPETAPPLILKDSEYEEFSGSTHAWAVFADKTEKRATPCDRIVGVLIILFQLFTYFLFAKEALLDYKYSSVPVMVSHDLCQENNQVPVDNFTCEAMETNDLDNLVAFFMLGIFLSSDFLQAGRAIWNAPIDGTTTIIFAILAGTEVLCAYLSASIAISYNLHIGEVTDAVEVGVGLLFIRELSSRAYAGLRYKRQKQYMSFFIVVAVLLLGGFIIDPTLEAIFVSNY